MNIRIELKESVRYIYFYKWVKLIYWDAKEKKKDINK